MTQFDIKLVAATKIKSALISGNLNFNKSDINVSYGVGKSNISDHHHHGSNDELKEHFIPDLEFFVKSQGTIKLKINAKSTFRVYFTSTKDTVAKPLYLLEVSDSAVSFILKNADQTETLLKKSTEKELALEKGIDVNYWFSIDNQNAWLKYGKGDATESLTLMKYQLDKETMLKELQYIATSLFVENLLKVKYYESPVVFQLPPFIAGNNDITLEDIEAGKVTSIGNLPNEIQKLHSVVAGTSIKLDEKVIVAIRNSLENGALKEKLIEKSKDPKHKSPLSGTYLRVTLGLNVGFSPGVPFVLEIWPRSHHSPIHRHSEAYACIKVLHGSIHSRFYSDLGTKILKPYMETNFKKDQISWISPSLYQTHQLENITQDFCATIQCYMFEKSDREHYEFFDFLDEEKKTISKFTPNSDYTYSSLIETLKKEGNLIITKKALQS